MTCGPLGPTPRMKRPPRHRVEGHRGHCRTGGGARAHLDDGGADVDARGAGEDPRGGGHRIGAPRLRRPHRVEAEVLRFEDDVHRHRHFRGRSSPPPDPASPCALLVEVENSGAQGNPPPTTHEPWPPNAYGKVRPGPANIPGPRGAATLVDNPVVINYTCPMREIHYSRTAQRALVRMPRNWAGRIREKIQSLCRRPGVASEQRHEPEGSGWTGATPGRRLARHHA